MRIRISLPLLIATLTLSAPVPAADSPFSSILKPKPQKTAATPPPAPAVDAATAAFAAAAAHADIGGDIVYQNAVHQIEIANIDGTGARPLAGCEHPVWFPDGSKVLCEESGDDHSVVDLKGNKVATYQFPGRVSDLAPDGRGVLMKRETLMDHCVAVRNIDSSFDDAVIYPRNIEAGAFDILGSRWSRVHPNVFYFILERSESRSIRAFYRYDLAAKKAERLFDIPQQSESQTWDAVSFALNPEETRVVLEVVATPMRPGPPLSSHLVMTDIHGKNFRWLTEGMTFNAAPDWSPDGRTLLFTQNRAPGEGGVYELRIMNADGTDARPVFRRGLSARSRQDPRWRPGAF